MRPTRRGIVLTVVGVVLLVIVAPACAALGLILGIGGGMDDIAETAPLASGTTYVATAGQETTIYGSMGRDGGGDGVSSSSGQAPGPRCQVRGESGESVSVTPSGGTTITRQGVRYVESGEFTPPTSGEYAITCPGGSAIVMNSGRAGHVLKRIFTIVAVGVGVAIVIGCIGLAALVVGIVRISRSGREISEFDRAHGLGYAGGPGYAPPPPGYGPPPPGYGPPPPGYGPKR